MMHRSLRFAALALATLTVAAAAPAPLGPPWISIEYPPSPYDATNNEIGPSSAPADGNTPHNHLHANPYPNTSSPGQTKECEAGNERFAQIGSKTVVGNQPGNQGLKTTKNPGIGARP